MTRQGVVPQLTGAGLGLRSEHYQSFVTDSPAIPWLEILSDNYLHESSNAIDYLVRIRENYPMAMHSVGMSLGSCDELNREYLTKLKHLMTMIEPSIISDHCCFISRKQQYLHELLPLPYTRATAEHIANRITQAQDFLGTRILIENVSSYLTYTMSDLTEWEFLNEVLTIADCNLLLDVNNVYVSSINHDFDAATFINALPKSRVKQIHLAGYTQQDGYLLDSHSALVTTPVWELYELAIKRFGKVPTLIEWDQDIPPLDTLLAQAHEAQTKMDAVS